MKLKKLALLLTLGATLMGGTVFAAGSPDSPFKPDEQVYHKGDLFTFDKQDVAKGKALPTGNSPLPGTRPPRIPPSRKSAT